MKAARGRLINAREWVRDRRHLVEAAKRAEERCLRAELELQDYKNDRGYWISEDALSHIEACMAQLEMLQK